IGDDREQGDHEFDAVIHHDRYAVAWLQPCGEVSREALDPFQQLVPGNDQAIFDNDCRPLRIFGTADGDQGGAGLEFDGAPLFADVTMRDACGHGATSARPCSMMTSPSRLVV